MILGVLLALERRSRRDCRYLVWREAFGWEELELEFTLEGFIVLFNSPNRKIREASTLELFYSRASRSRLHSFTGSLAGNCYFLWKRISDIRLIVEVRSGRLSVSWLSRFVSLLR